jgi:solute carrier family 29 (equilibrative nucleoside transporter), member 1/2/3
VATLQFLLTLSTYIHLPAGVFFAFVLLNGAVQMAAGSYLQTSVVACASLFGPNIMQAVMSGQAAVGVAVSAVQVLSASASVWHDSPKSPAALRSRAESRDPEEGSAFLFFGLSTLFLILCAALSTWLTALPAYKAIVVPFESQRKYTSLTQDDERQHLVSPRESASASHESRDKIMHLAKANIIYEVAVAYVFVITLVNFSSFIFVDE